MRIIIVGAGKLGYSIAELLCKEQYEVIVMDKDEEQLEAVKNTLDALTLCANGASPKTLGDKDIKNADVLIAVTSSDEVNMVACTLAKQNGIAHTVARIRDVEFLGEMRDYTGKVFSIDLIINPEIITAEELNRILTTPAALNVEDFADGKVRLFETKVRDTSPYAGKPLKDIQMPRSILAGMIFRDKQMIIPHGDDCLLPFDNAYFIGRTEDIEHFSKNFVQRESHKLQRALIIGAGRIGRALAVMMEKQGTKVKLIDNDREQCRQAAELLDNGIAICGDGTDIDLLTEEAAGEANVVVCLTEDDKLNLMIALLAKHLGAHETAVRVARGEYIELMEKVGVDVVVSPRMLAAADVLAFVRRSGVVSVSLFEGAQAEAVEVIVQEGASVAHKPLKDVRLPRECLVCAYVRDADAVIPNGDTVLLPGDRAILFTHTQSAKKVMRYFAG